MSDGTKIEWTDATWNPITGCSVISPGCANCYAMKLAGTRLQHHPSRAGLTRETKAGPVWNGTIRFNEEWLGQPLHWKRPRMVFVCAHGDLFHEDVPNAWIDRVFAVMALSPQHTFQVLTKRAERMRAYLSRHRWHLWAAAGRIIDAHRWENLPPIMGCDYTPLPNVWLGISAEDQQRADERVPELLATRAAVRFVSAEPMLGPISFETICARGGSVHDALRGWVWGEDHGPKLDWIIAGGENGPRPMQAEWAQSIRDQCATAGTAFFFKQWGSHIPAGQTMANGKVWQPGCGTRLRATKSITGRLLDGIEHSAMPHHILSPLGA